MVAQQYSIIGDNMVTTVVDGSQWHIAIGSFQEIRDFLVAGSANPINQKGIVLGPITNNARTGSCYLLYHR